MSKLSKIGLRFAPLSARPVIARFGKDPAVALETRDAESEVIAVLMDWTDGGVKSIVFRDERDGASYKLSINPEPKKEARENGPLFTATGERI